MHGLFCERTIQQVNGFHPAQSKKRAAHNLRAAAMAAAILPLLLSCAPKAAQGAEAPSSKSQASLINARLSRWPLAFEENRGQTDPAVDFLSHGRGYSLWLTPTEAVFSLRPRSAAEAGGRHGQASSPTSTTRDILRMRLVRKQSRASAGQAVPGDKLRGTVSYYSGNDRSKWVKGASTYGKVRYPGVYKGVDLVYHGQQGQLEYDFEVAPGADPRQIELQFNGARDVTVDASGDLILDLPGGKMRWHKPVTYQQTRAGRRVIASRYALRSGKSVGFEVAKYDPARPLVIDPTLDYSTYLGGGSTDVANGVATYTNGSGHKIAYVVGTSDSSTFPTSGASNSSGSQGIIVASIDTDATGSSSFLNCAYLVGGGGDQGNGIAVSSGGTVYIIGTSTPYLDPMDGKYKDGLSSSTSMNGGHNPNTQYADAYVAILSSSLGFQSGFFQGGSRAETGESIAVDSNGNFYAVGMSNSFAAVSPLYTTEIAFPVTAGTAYQSTMADTPAANAMASPYGDVFLAKYSSGGGGSPAYATYLGGVSHDVAYSVAVDNSGNAYLTGYTLSGSYPVTSGCYQGTISGTFCGIVAKLDTTQSGSSSLVYSTYLGGNHETEGEGIAIDSSGHAFVIGYTDGGFPTTSGALQTSFNKGGGTTWGHYDAFVTELNTTGTGLLYSTYFGGSGNEQGFGIAVDGSGYIYITGYSDSQNFPMVGKFPMSTVNPLQSAVAGGKDVFVAKITPSGGGTSDLLFSTYLGGSSDDAGYGIALNGSTVHVGGVTSSSAFPTSGAYQSSNQGGFSDAIVVRITP